MNRELASVVPTGVKDCLGTGSTYTLTREPGVTVERDTNNPRSRETAQLVDGTAASVRCDSPERRAINRDISKSHNIKSDDMSARYFEQSGVILRGILDNNHE